jgi:hypothetical protein
MKFRRTVLSVSIAAIVGTLTACGGGGGGGGGSATMGAFVRSQVPYHTPTNVGSFSVYQNASTKHYVSDIFVRDLNADSVDEVVIGGRMTAQPTVATHSSSRLQIYGWNTGTFASETTRWFSGTDNVILGTEPSIKFGDFNGDGRIDMFVSPGTDMALYGPGIAYINQGNSFTRTNIDFGQVWSHDSAVVDLNGDGYADILVADYNRRPAVAFGSANGAFTVYRGASGLSGASGVSVADFLGNGTKTIIKTDSNVTGRSDTNLYSWAIQNGELVLSIQAVLPESRFYLSKWDSVRAANPNLAPHDIRNIAMDFDRDGRTDVIVFSTMPQGTNAHGYSEVQFLRNNGNGSFTDVTDSVLRNYNTSRTTSYQPQLIDVNNDGLLDIFLSVTDYTGNPSTTVLVNTQEGIFVEQYTSVFADFSRQIASMQGVTVNGTQAINIVNGPNNVKFLVSTVQYEQNGNTMATVYLSQIGSFGTVTAQASVATLQSVWPWMSPTAANESLARTAFRNWAGYDRTVHGEGIIDLMSALNPIGGLGISFNGRTGERRPIAGGIAVPGFDNSLLNNLTAVDGLARNFQVNLSAMSATPRPMRPMWSEITAPAQSWASRFVAENNLTENSGLSAYSDGANYTTGFNTRAFGWNSPWIAQASVTRMQGSPWMAFTGIFGQIKTSGIVDMSMTRLWNNGAWAQLGGMQTTTQFDSGLVTRVDPIYSVYAVGGWRDDTWSFYGGLQPTIVGGSLDLNLPKSVDSQGVLHYQSQRVKIQNDPVMFAGFERRWTERQHSFRFGGMINDRNIYTTRVGYEYKF